MAEFKLERMPQTRAEMEALFDEIGGPHRPLCQVLLNLAECYNRVSVRALGTISETKNADFAAPAIMCKAFAVELLLKSFIAMRYGATLSFDEIRARGARMNVHFYSGLFKQISHAHKAEIVSAFSRIIGRQASINDFKNALEQLGDDPFVKWRYVYEKDDLRHIDLALFDQVADALGIVAAGQVQALLK